MEVRGKLVSVSRPYYQVETNNVKQCVSFVICDSKGRNRFFSVSNGDDVKLIMISEPGDDLLLGLVYHKDCGMFRAGHFLQSIQNLTLGITEGIQKFGKQRVNGNFIRISRAFCLTTTFFHGGHFCAKPEVIVRAVFVLCIKDKNMVIETTKMEVIQFLQMSHLGDALVVEFSYSGEISYIRNKNLRITYQDLCKNI